MGLTFSSIFDALSGLTRWTKDKDVRILMLGLDSAGKVRTADLFLGMATDNPGCRRRFFTGYRYFAPLATNENSIIQHSTARLERLFRRYRVSSRSENSHESH